MAMTGAIFGENCYPSNAEALDAYYSQVAPAQTPGTTSYVNEFVKVSGVWQVKQYSVSSTGVWTTRSTTAAPVVTFPACDPSGSFMDGITVGWGVAAAMVLASSLVLIKRATS